MSSDKKANTGTGSPGSTKNANIETTAAIFSLSGATTQPLAGSSQPPAGSPATPSGFDTGVLPPAATPIRPTASVISCGGAGARSPEIQRALSGQHDYFWYTDNFHLAKANNIIAADNAERRERQRSASLVPSPEPAKDEKEEKKVKTAPILNLENKKPAALAQSEKADDSKGSGDGGTRENP